MNTKTQELKNLIERRVGNHGHSTMNIDDIEKLAEENDLVIIHNWVLSLDHVAYQAAKNDENILHFVYDINKYLHGVNVEYFSRVGWPQSSF